MVSVACLSTAVQHPRLAGQSSDSFSLTFSDCWISRVLMSSCISNSAVTATICKTKSKTSFAKVHDVVIVSKDAHLEDAYPDILHGQRCVFFTLLPAQWTKAIEGYGHLCMHNAVLFACTALSCYLVSSNSITEKEKLCLLASIK